MKRYGGGCIPNSTDNDKTIISKQYGRFEVRRIRINGWSVFNKYGIHIDNCTHISFVFSNNGPVHSVLNME